MSLFHSATETNIADISEDELAGYSLRKRITHEDSESLHIKKPRETIHYFGMFLLVITFLGFMVSIYAIVASKFMPETGNPILDFIAQDRYYCLLIPATVPIGVIFVYINWLSMKFFRHN